MGVRERSLGEFLESVAAATPTPAGGSVAALAGALSIALSRMAMGLALAKEGDKAREVGLRSLETRAQDVQRRLEELVEEDAKAFEAVLAARRMPRTNDSEKALRVERMQAAYRIATRIPLETAQGCLEALKIADEATQKGSRSAITDVGVAIALAEAGMRGASLNCRVNLAAIRDEAFRDETERRLRELLDRGEEIRQRAAGFVDEGL